MSETLLPAAPEKPPIRRKADAATPRELFEREGRRFECSANKPLMLSSTNEAWWVVNESVELFVAAIDDGGSLGPRQHIARIPAGVAFFSISAKTRDRAVIAVGSAGTELLRIGRTRLHELMTEPRYTEATAEIVAGWVATLSAASFRGRLPNEFREITHDARLVADAGERIMSRSDVVWIKTRGSASYMGVTPVRSETLFPLTSRRWIEAVDSTEVEACGAGAWIESPDRWEALGAFEDVAMRTIVDRIDGEKAEERHRLERKRVADQHSMRRSIAALASVLTPVDAVAGEVGGEDPLFAACRLIGAAGGMSVLLPPPTQSGDPVAAIARASRLRLRRVALRGEWWRDDNGPLLAFTAGDKHPVAVLPSPGGGYEAVHTTTGNRLRVTREVAEGLDAFAFVFYRPLAERALAGRDVLRFAGFGTAEDLKRFLAVGIGGGALMLLIPIATAVVFNFIIPGADRAGLVQIVLALVMAAVATSVFQVTRDVAVLRIEGKMDGQLQAAMWDRVLSLPIPFFRSYSSGDLAQRTMAVNSIRELLSNYVVGALTGGLFSILTFALLFYYDWRLALVATAVVLFAVALTVINALLQLKYQRPVYALQGALSGLMFQFIVGIAKLRVAGAETRAFAHWSARFAEQKRLSNAARDSGSWVLAANSIVPVVASIAIFAWIGLAGHASLDIGDFTGFYAALGIFLASMLAMSSSLVSVMGVIPIWERARPILQTVPEADTSKTDPGELTGDIEVNHVSFRYDPAGPLVLSDVSFHAAPGEFVAIVGPSGSGKSTVLRLLLGFEPPEAGAVYYDRQDLAGVDIRAVRRQVGVVLQSGQLMPGDIYTNIVGSSPLTVEDAMEAAEMAGLSEDIQNLPMGVHTVISEGGSTFSGGQKQRLMIARAIVNRPRILLFDEATSALDNRTQAIVSRSLESLKTTRIVIAHRLSTIVKADRIYVFDKGRVVQSGSYDELIRQEGAFAELARRQML